MLGYTDSQQSYAAELAEVSITSAKWISETSQRIFGVWIGFKLMDRKYVYVLHGLMQSFLEGYRLMNISVKSKRQTATVFTYEKLICYFRLINLRKGQIFMANSN